MARKQILVGFVDKIVAASGTPEALSATEYNVKSVAIQGLTTNTNFIYVGDANNQNYAIAPGKSLTIHGDALDIGGYAYINLAEVFIRVDVSGEGVSFIVLEGI